MGAPGIRASVLDPVNSVWPIPPVRSCASFTLSERPPVVKSVHCAGCIRWRHFDESEASRASRIPVLRDAD